MIKYFLSSKTTTRNLSGMVLRSKITCKQFQEVYKIPLYCWKNLMNLERKLGFSENSQKVYVSFISHSLTSRPVFTWDASHTRSRDSVQYIKFPRHFLVLSKITHEPSSITRLRWTWSQYIKPLTTTISHPITNLNNFKIGNQLPQQDWTIKNKLNSSYPKLRYSQINKFMCKQKHN